MFKIDPKTGNTSLMVDVVNNNREKIIRILQSPDLSQIIDLQNKEGNTALHYAINNPDLLELLISNGANPLIPNNHGDTVFDFVSKYAESNSQYEKVKQMIEGEYAHLIEKMDLHDETEIIEDLDFLHDEINFEGNSTAKFLFNQIKVYVWDFDCTITKLHSCANKIYFTPFAPINSVIADVDLFRQTIFDLQKYGKEVAIASYGEKNLIFETMKKIFGDQNPFSLENIVTPFDVSQQLGIKWLECHEPPPGYNKNYLLRILQERFRARGLTFNNDELLLLDDTSNNIRLARDQGYYGITIPKGVTGCNGFNRNLSPYLVKILQEGNFPLLWGSFLQSMLR